MNKEGRAGWIVAAALAVLLIIVRVERPAANQRDLVAAQAQIQKLQAEADELSERLDGAHKLIIRLGDDRRAMKKNWARRPSRHTTGRPSQDFPIAEMARRSITHPIYRQRGL